MKKMICFIGLTGAGKSTYLDTIMANKDDKGLEKLNRLVYYTTRAPRPGEVDGVDYYFAKDGKKPVSLVSIKSENGGTLLSKNPELIEERIYSTMNNGTVWYYTTTDCVKEDYYVCAPSIEQLNSYIDYFGDDKIAVIEIVTEMKERMIRILNKRAYSDDDIYELCRRVVQEKEDWSRAHYDTLFERHKDIKYLPIDNTNEKDLGKNLNEVVEFIRDML